MKRPGEEHAVSSCTLSVMGMDVPFQKARAKQWHLWSVTQGKRLPLVKQLISVPLCYNGKYVECM